MEKNFSHSELVAITIRANLASLFNKINMALQIDIETEAVEELSNHGISMEHIPTHKIYS